MTDAQPAPRRVVIVPHTHWDREWYEPFQTFRLKLVDLLDELLPRLEADPSYAHFMLDGQMAVVDDYLAVRPEEEGRLRRLAASGRIGMGPWYILMDEFLVSGETIVRDLQLGLERAAAFGGAMEVGYLPDMFGHVAQMPQLLDQFGFGHAVVWRGVPAAVDRSAFWWEAPDGTAVRAEYLPDGYWNGQRTPDDAKALLGRIERFEQRWGDLLVGPLLWMNGMDHEMPQPWLGRVVAEANALGDAHHLEVASLPSYLADAPTEGLPRWRGELRSGARANLLMGVASNRVDVKQAAAAAERWLERVAEPATALFGDPGRWPGAVLGEAWLQVIRNSAHDSSCACSADDVDAAVLVRYAEARHIAEGLARRAADACAARLAERGEVVVNTTAQHRSGLVELRLWGTDPWPGTQQLGLRGGVRPSADVPLAGAVELVLQAAENAPELGSAELLDGDDGVLEVRLHPGPPDGERLDVATAVAELLARRDAAPRGARGRLSVALPEGQKVLALAHRVPGFGWQRWSPAALDDLGVEPVDVQGDGSGPTIVVNGLVTVVVDPADGTFSLDGTGGMGRLVDDGDVGDTYNWCPPTQQRIVDHPTTVAVRVDERGPLRARVVVEATYRLPARAEGMVARTGEVEVPVTTTIEVQAASRAVRVTHEVDNRAADHRLRAWFPLPEPAVGSRAECAFAVVERGLAAEGGPSEQPLPTYPMRRFVLAGGLTVVQDGLLEYELTDLAGPAGPDGEVDASSPATCANALALTLLRCTGLISQGPMVTRPLPAGPMTPTPAAQLPGRRVLRYAVATGDDPAEAYRLADEVLTPLLLARSRGRGDRPDAGTELEVHGVEVSAVLRQGGDLVVRVFNPTDEEATVELPGRHGWRVDLRGRPLAPFEQSFALRPWGIATLQLTEA